MYRFQYRKMHARTLTLPFTYRKLHRRKNETEFVTGYSYLWSTRASNPFCCRLRLLCLHIGLESFLYLHNSLLGMEHGLEPNRTRKTGVIPKTVIPSNSNQNLGWNQNRIQCFSIKKYAKKSILSVLNCKIVEFFKIITSIGVLNSKIVPFKTKFEGHNCIGTIIKFIVKL